MKVLYQDDKRIRIFLNSFDLNKYQLDFYNNEYTDIKELKKNIKRYFKDIEHIFLYTRSSKYKITIKKVLNIGAIIEIVIKKNADLFDQIYDFKVVFSEIDEVLFSFADLGCIINFVSLGRIYYQDSIYYLKITDNIEEKLVDKLFEFGKLDIGKFVISQNEVTNIINKIVEV